MHLLFWNFRHIQSMKESAQDLDCVFLGIRVKNSIAGMLFKKLVGICKTQSFQLWREETWAWAACDHDKKQIATNVN